ncbi:MAG TPA: ROK family glucokinase [Jiangellaceae bacterium]|nr:ROK family glucokinase [Jiangellaceae bacterium]
MGVAIGIDVGGTKIAGGLVDDAGVIIARTRRDTPSTDPRAIVDNIVSVVQELRRDRSIDAVGVGSAGFVDAARSTVLFAPNLAWRDVAVRDQVVAATELPVVVENDANAAAWGEFRYGAAEDVDDMVCVTVGTGIGGGLVLDGAVYRGAHGVGAELGHMRVVPNGHLCGCGNRGCLEQYASGSALVREARALASAGSVFAARLLELAGGDPEKITGPMVTLAARDGDVAARELLTDLGRWLGEGLASFAAILDPAVFVIGGGVSAAGDLLLGPASDAFRRNLTGRGYRPEAEIRVAMLGNDAGIVGAADLARV